MKTFRMKVRMGGESRPAIVSDRADLRLIGGGQGNIVLLTRDG